MFTPTQMPPIQLVRPINPITLPSAAKPTALGKPRPVTRRTVPVVSGPSPFAYFAADFIRRNQFRERHKPPEPVGSVEVKRPLESPHTRIRQRPPSRVHPKR